MRRVSVCYVNGDVHVWKCTAASWGPDSRNLVLYNARLDGTTETDASIERVCLPLARVASVMEGPW